MSLFSTIAYDGTHETKQIPYKGIGAAVAALVLGAAIGFVIADNPPAVDAPVAAATGMALDDFIRLNTTSYEGLAPVTAAVATPQTDAQSFIEMNVTSFEGLAPVTAAVATPQTDPQSFIEMNVTPFEGLAPVTTTVDPFLEMNVTSFEGVAPVTATVATPQTATNSFLNMNVRSYDGLVPSAVAETHKTVDPSFLYWNVEAFNNLSPVEASAVLRSVTTADRNLWAINVTSYGNEAYEYAEQPGGPR
jgi:hypothetical protein